VGQATRHRRRRQTVRGLLPRRRRTLALRWHRLLPPGRRTRRERWEPPWSCRPIS
jgi:hypothetical protein